MTTEVIQGLEIHNPTSGAKLAIIETYYAAQWRQQINTPDELTFTVPTATAPASLVKYNEVWVRRGDAATLVRKFVITGITTTRGEINETQVQCYDPLMNLMRTAVDTFPATADLDADEYMDAALAIERALAYQSVITLGVRPPAGILIPAGDIKATDSNVLEVLHKIRDIIGGLIWVSNDKELHWYRNRWPEADEYKLELDRNTIGITKRVDSLTGEDIIAYDVDVIDLSAHGGADDGMLNIGMPVLIESTPGAWDTTVYITDITQDLGDPLALKIAVAGADYIGDITDPWPTGTDRDDPLTWSSAREQDINDIIRDLIVTPADEEPTTVGREVGDAGRGEEFSRYSHKHGVDYGEAGDVKDVGTGTAGSAPRIAHADHSHGIDLASLDDALQALGYSILCRAKIVTFYAGSLNRIVCNLWDSETDDWSTEETDVMLPQSLDYNNWHGLDIEYILSNGIETQTVSYAAKGGAEYVRVATWTDEGHEYEEEQYITPLYATGKEIRVVKVGDNWEDINVDGRAWARYEDVP